MSIRDILAKISSLSSPQKTFLEKTYATKAVNNEDGEETQEADERMTAKEKEAMDDADDATMGRMRLKGMREKKSEDDEKKTKKKVGFGKKEEEEMSEYSSRCGLCIRAICVDFSRFASSAFGSHQPRRSLQRPWRRRRVRRMCVSLFCGTDIQKHAVHHVSLIIVWNF